MDHKEDKKQRKDLHDHHHEGHDHHHEGHDHNHHEHHHLEAHGKHHKDHHEEHGHDHHGGHGHHDHHHHGDFKKIFLTSLPIGLIIMWISPLMGIKIPFPFQYTFKYSDIVALVLSLMLIVYGGKPFSLGAFHELKAKSPGMMALVSMGLGVSFLYSAYAIIMRYVTTLYYMDFLFEFASLVLIMLLGHWIEMVALGKAGDAKASLAKLLPKEVNVIDSEGHVKQIALKELKIGDRIQAQAGESIAADGIVLSGESRVDESLLTGESKPVIKQKGDVVIGGSINQHGLLIIEVTEVGEKSFLSQVTKLVEMAENQPSRAEDMAKRVAGLLFYIALFVAVIAWIIWWIIADLESGVNVAVATLVIACPHALGLAIPLVVSRSTSIGAKSGLLIKDRNVYNLTTKADIMILDKTGTLTTGVFSVLQLDLLDDEIKADEAIGLLSGLEQGSSHPIATSIINYAKEKNIKPIKFNQISVLSGIGLEGRIGKDLYKLISQKAYGKDIKINETLGATISILIKNEQAIAAIYLGDQLKPSSKSFIQNLKNKGIKPIMATGDNELAAKEVANKLDITYLANQTPKDKYELVSSYKEKGHIVIMVGDGINDAPSLALADAGVAIGAGTQVAIDSADVILTNSEPGDIEAFIDLSFKTHRKMNENLIWGAGYNFIAIPIAAGILAPIGFILSPALGATLMSLSTIIVALNAITLNIKKKV